MEELFTIPLIETGGDVATMSLPNASLYDYWRLFNKRILYLDGEITDSCTDYAREIMMFNIEDICKPREQRMPILFLINSNGGCLDVTNTIVDTIMASETPVYTVNMGNALSGGILIFLAGEKRFAMKNSYAMAHAGSGGVSGTFDQSVEMQKQWDAQVKNMLAYIVSRTSIDEKTMKKNKNKDWYFNQEQQIQYGIATDKLDSLSQLFGG